MRLWIKKPLNGTQANTLNALRSYFRRTASDRGQLLVWWLGCSIFWPTLFSATDFLQRIINTPYTKYIALGIGTLLFICWLALGILLLRSWLEERKHARRVTFLDEREKQQLIQALAIGYGALMTMFLIAAIVGYFVPLKFLMIAGCAGLAFGSLVVVMQWQLLLTIDKRDV